MRCRIRTHLLLVRLCCFLTVGMMMTCNRCDAMNIIRRKLKWPRRVTERKVSGVGDRQRAELWNNNMLIIIKDISMSTTLRLTRCITTHTDTHTQTLYSPYNLSAAVVAPRGWTWLHFCWDHLPASFSPQSPGKEDERRLQALAHG